MAVIEVERLRRTYGDRVAVADVSFEVEEGEIFGILGPNGAGKTTTVECISGLRRPDRGRLRVLGHDPVRDRAEVTAAVGVQLQHSELQPNLRVGEALEPFSSFYEHPVDWRELAEANLRLEATMAENAGLHAQLLVQAREAGVVDERQRLAGEIHDTLAQGLAGIVAQLEAAEQARHHPGEWSRHLGQARDLARASLTEARRSVRALRPEQLEGASLPEAISGLACTWSEQAMVAAELETNGTPTRAGPDTEATVFRVAQEALANVAKHAQASKVHLTLTYLDDAVLLDVTDDGVGFDPDASADGYGLVGMAQRLSRVSGALTVESAPGNGTTVNAAVPLGPRR